MSTLLLRLDLHNVCSCVPLYLGQFIADCFDIAHLTMFQPDERHAQPFMTRGTHTSLIIHDTDNRNDKMLNISKYSMGLPTFDGILVY